VFDSKFLKSEKVKVIWSARLTTTAGHCATKTLTNDVVLTLSEKVCDTPERCRDTLIHELCHAAVFLIDGVFAHNHGHLWKKWTKLAEQIHPRLPKIKITHTYKVFYKFVYRCTKCQYEVFRHTKSLNIDSDYCGRCMNKFELLLNAKNDDEQTRQTTTTTSTIKRTPNRYNLFVKENFQKFQNSNPYLSTPMIMKQLSQAYRQQSQPSASAVATLLDFDKLQI